MRLPLSATAFGDYSLPATASIPPVIHSDNHAGSSDQCRPLFYEGRHTLGHCVHSAVSTPTSYRCPGEKRLTTKLRPDCGPVRSAQLARKRSGLDTLSAHSRTGVQRWVYETHASGGPLPEPFSRPLTFGGCTQCCSFAALTPSIYYTSTGYPSWCNHYAGGPRGPCACCRKRKLSDLGGPLPSGDASCRPTSPKTLGTGLQPLAASLGLPLPDHLGPMKVASTTGAEVRALPVSSGVGRFR